MRADGLWQSILWTEEINGARSSVVASKDCSLCLFVGRQGVVHVGDSGNHLRPAKLVSKVLRQQALHAGFRSRDIYAEPLKVGCDSFGRKDRQHNRRSDASDKESSCRQGDIHPSQTSMDLSDAFPEGASSSEKHGIDRREVVVLPLEVHHHPEEGKIRDSHKPVASNFFEAKYVDQSGDPDQGAERAEHHHLLLKEWEWRQLYVFVERFYISQILESWEMIDVLPNKVRHCNCNSNNN